MKNLPWDKASAGEVPNKILKESEFCFLELTSFINESLTDNDFADILKLSQTAPVFLQLDRIDKANYRTLTTLPHVAMVFEKIIYDQL